MPCPGAAGGAFIDALGGRYRVIAPDYPGFGYTQTPEDFAFSFDRLADIIEGFAGLVDGFLDSLALAQR